MSINISITRDDWQIQDSSKNKMADTASAEKRRIMNDFLMSVERRAFAIAQMAVTNPDDALELVQESMLKLVQLYINKPQEQWTPLFYKILQSRIRDWYRRSKVKNRIFSWFSGSETNDEQDTSVVERMADLENTEPEQKVTSEIANEHLQKALKTLSLRQQQVFLLRAWEGMNVKEAAFVMKCSEGSVKTHYSRALNRLKDLMQEWDNE